MVEEVQPTIHFHAYLLQEPTMTEPAGTSSMQ